MPAYLSPGFYTHGTVNCVAPFDKRAPARSFHEAIESAYFGTYVFPRRETISEGRAQMAMGYVYHRNPIDFWLGWQSIDQISEEIDRDGEYATSSMKDIEKFINAAKEAARGIGWEGDIREGPFLTGLPSTTGNPDTLIAVAWKQDNNGETFVASPIVIPWLAEDDTVGSAAFSY